LDVVTTLVASVLAGLVLFTAWTARPVKKMAPFHFGNEIITKVNDADLRLRDFNVLSVVLRERSLTRAAEALETTQPSVSKVLARLRTHFDDPLFVRHGLTMHPTAKALEISEPLHGLLLAADTLAEPSRRFDPRTSDRVFKILTADVGMARDFLSPTYGSSLQGPQLSSWGPCLGSASKL